MDASRVDVYNPLVTIELMAVDGHTQHAGDKLLVELRHLAIPGNITKAAWDAHAASIVDLTADSSEEDISDDDDASLSSVDTMSADDDSPAKPAAPKPTARTSTYRWCH
eukprot:COSAG05_NODE_540_length_8845_cov_13.872742_14_plen_109_part_00